MVSSGICHVGGMTESESRKREELWRQRVRAWEASGLSAPRFAKGKDFSGSGLLYWRRRLRAVRKEKAPEAEVSFAQMVPRGARVPEVLGTAELVVEVAGAVIRVGSGFDAAVFRAVLAALQNGGDQ